jgi:hypothetical protein
LPPSCAGLDEIDPAQLGGKKGGDQPVEAGNMKFQTRLVGDDALRQRGIERPNPDREWYNHVVSDLLDRIHVESSDHSRATQAKDSWVFASRTDPRFDSDNQYPNQWWPIDRDGKPKGGAVPQRYAGGASTTKISRLASAPGTLLVEGHLAFAEPRAWFDGAPILRSKISLVVQDQIRRLRRELAQRKAKEKP